MVDDDNLSLSVLISLCVVYIIEPGHCGCCEEWNALRILHRDDGSSQEIRLIYEPHCEWPLSILLVPLSLSLSLYQSYLR